MKRSLWWTMLVAVGCSTAPPKKDEPFGQLPTAVTSAEPMWIPFSIGAGSAKPDDRRETLLASLRQLTSDNKSWGAAWHPSGTSIFYTSQVADSGCGQLFHMDLVTGDTKRVSPSGGWAASPDALGEQIVFVRGTTDVCPRTPTTLSWPVGKYDVFAGPAGGATKVIDGAMEVGAARNGSLLVFTSLRDGDPELYVTTGSDADARRVTHATGYDGGAQVAPDGGKLAWHAERPNDAERQAYDARLAEGKFEPASLRLLVASTSGKHALVIEHGRFSMSPSFLPDSRRLVFASNADDVSAEQPRNFEIYLVDPEGPVTASGRPRIDRITHHDGFDGEARVSPDGKFLLFTSSRGAPAGGTNVFVARWLGE